MPTACTLDALEITAVRPGDPRSKYFAGTAMKFAKRAVFDEVKVKLQLKMDGGNDYEFKRTTVRT